MHGVDSNAGKPRGFRARAIAYDQLQPCADTVVASHDISAGRPCERRDPSPLASRVKKGLCSSAETRVRAAAMSAIALTLGSLRSQGRLIENSICDSLPQAGRGEVSFTAHPSRSSSILSRHPMRESPAPRVERL